MIEPGAGGVLVTVPAGCRDERREATAEGDPAWSEQDGRRGTTARLPEPVSPPAGANGPDEVGAALAGVLNGRGDDPGDAGARRDRHGVPADGPGRDDRARRRCMRSSPISSPTRQPLAGVAASPCRWQGRGAGRAVAASWTRRSSPNWCSPTASRCHDPGRATRAMVEFLGRLRARRSRSATLSRLGLPRRGCQRHETCSYQLSCP